MQRKFNVNIRLKIFANSKYYTTVNTVTILQKNWLIGSAKRKQGNVTIRDVLVHSEIKHMVYCQLSLRGLSGMRIIRAGL